MFVIALHDSQDPDRFWSSAKALGDSIPPTLKLHTVFPSTDMKTGTCLWEGPSATDVQEFLDANVGSVSKNSCYEVNQEASIGLPQMAIEAAAANN